MLNPSRRRGALNTRHAIAALLAAALLVASTSAALGNDPTRVWYSVDTPHFTIHSYGDSEELVRRVASHCEEAYEALNGDLGWVPEERIHVAVIDAFDGANGFAGVVPYAAMTLYAFPPPAHSDLGNFSNWLKLLIFHEYAHIAHLDNATGVPHVVNTVLGKTLKPNQLTPRWFTEGVAVWVESTYTGGGRVGSSRFEMYLRAAALADDLPSLAEITGSPLRHPRGASYYMYGGYLFDLIAREAGPDRIRRLLTSYGKRIVPPYALNIHAKAATGRSFDEWHERVLTGVRERAAKRVAKVEAEGRIEGRRITEGGEFKEALTFGPEGQLLWVQADGLSPQRLVAGLVPATGYVEPQTVLRCEGGCGDFSFTRDGQRILLATTRFHQNINIHGTLTEIPARVGLPRRTPRVIPGTRRAQYPSAAASGQGVWSIMTSWSQATLEERDIASGKLLRRFVPPKGARLDAAVATPQGDAVYLSMHHDGNRDLYRLELASMTLSRLTNGASIELDLSLSHDGRWLLYSSDVDGVYNIYARRLIGTPVTKKLTNVVLGAFDPALSPDGRTLAYTGWTADGFEIYALAVELDAAKTVATADGRQLLAAEPPTLGERVGNKRNYEPLPTMLPRSWLPTYTATSAGLHRVGLAFGGADMSGQYSALASIDYDLDRGDVSAQVSGTLSTFTPDLTLTLGRYSWDRTAFIGDEVSDYREEVLFATAGASLSVPSVFVPMFMSARYTVDISRALEKAEYRHTPGEFVPFLPAEGLSSVLRLSWGFGDTQGATFTVGPSRGVSGGLTFSLRDPAIGSDRTNVSLTYRANAYLQNPWLRDHTLALRAEGGWSGGDEDTRAVYRLGGVPEQDIVGDLLNETGPGAIWLRGFEPGAFAGQAYHLVTAEYRLPLLRLRHGIGNLPVFFQDLTLAVFSDVGVAYRGPFADALGEIHGGIGAELRFGVDLFYGIFAHFRLGYARGLGPDGVDQVYLLMAPAP